MNRLYIRYFLVILLFAFAGGLNAQVLQWQKNYGGTSYDEGVKTKELPGGGFITLNTTLSSDSDVSGPVNGNYDMWLVKTDVSGSILWDRSYGTPANEVAKAIDLTQSGGFILAGTTADTNKTFGRTIYDDFWIVNVDSNGDTLWTKTYGGAGVDVPNSIFSTTDGGYIVAGRSNSLTGYVNGNHGNYDYWVLKLDAAGDTVWTRSYGGSGYDEAFSVKQTVEGGYILSGYSRSTNFDVVGNHGGADVWLVKLDYFGAFEFKFAFGGTSDDFGYDVKQAADFGYIIGASTSSNNGNVSGNHGGLDGWLLKTDQFGTFAWQKCLGGALTDEIHGVVQASTGEFVFAASSNSTSGNITSSKGSYDYWLGMVSNSGSSLLWQKNYGGSNVDKVNDIIATTDNGYLVTGLSISTDKDVKRNKGNYDNWTIKVDGTCFNSTVNFTPSGSNILCAGSSLSFTNNTVYTGTVSYKWKINGVTFDSSATGTNYTFNTPGNQVIRLVASKSSTCADSTELIITVNANPAKPTITPGDSTICAFTPIIFTSSPEASYQWLKNGVAIPSETNSSITLVTDSSAQYSVVVTNANACSNTSNNVNLTVNPLPSKPVIFSNPPSTPPDQQVVCFGDNVRLAASQGNAGYLWSDGSTTRSISFSASSTNTYYVTVSNSYGCTEVSDPDFVTVNPLPTPVITANSPITFCADKNVILKSSGPYVTYIWNNGVNIDSADVNTSGDYYVIVTDVNGCRDTSNHLTVTVNSFPTPVATANGPTSFCNGDSVLINTTPYSRYVWYKDYVATADTLQGVEAKSNGTYNVKVTDSNGCTAYSSDTIVVRVMSSPSRNITVFGDSTFCDGDFRTIAADPGYGHYQWSTGLPQDTLNTLRITAAGTYYAIVGSGNCLDTTRSVTFFVNPKPVISITPNGPTTFCQGGSVTLDATPGFSTYSWSMPGAQSSSVTATLSDSIFVMGVDVNGCKDTSSIVVVKVNPLPSKSILANGPTTFCNGSSVDLSLSPGLTYAWVGGQTSQTITATTSGKYYATITDANTCTNVSDTAFVVTSPRPLAVIFADGATTFCVNQSVVLSDTTLVGANKVNATYKWNIGSSTSSVLPVFTSGTYYEIVTNSFGCKDSSNSITVTVNSLPTPTITALTNTTVCLGDTVKLRASSGFVSYVWSVTYDTSRTIATAPTKVGSWLYNVSVTDANGCTNTSNSLLVRTVANPKPAISASDTTRFCQGGSVILRAPAGFSLYKWSNNSTSQTITVTATGTFKVTVTNSTGCTGTSAVVNVYVDTLPDKPTFKIKGNVLTSSSDFGNQWYVDGKIIAGATNKSLIAKVDGYYRVRVTNGFGCYAESDTAFVKIPAYNSISDPGPVNSLTVYPNPFSDKAVISYIIQDRATVSIEVYNVLGEKLLTLADNELQSTGEYKYEITSQSIQLASGVLFVKIKVDGKIITQRIIRNK